MEPKYTVRAVADAIEKPSTAIRQWSVEIDRAFAGKKGYISDGGPGNHRRFSEREVAQLAIVRQLSEFGVALKWAFPIALSIPIGPIMRDEANILLCVWTEFNPDGSVSVKRQHIFDGNLMSVRDIRDTLGLPDEHVGTVLMLDVNKIVGRARTRLKAGES